MGVGVSSDRAQKVLRGFPPHLLTEGLIDNTRLTPTFLSVHSNPVCNFKCGKCFIGDMTELAGGRRRLELTEIESIAKNGRAAGAKVFGISGAGEPLADKLSLDILSMTSGLGFINYLATNAALLDEQKLVALRESNVTLVISLDTANPVKFAKLTGTNVRTFERVIHNLRIAQEVYSGTSEAKTIGGKELLVYRLAVHSTTSEIDVHEIEGIRELLDERTTLLSVSPIAAVKSATGISSSIQGEAERELTERHIVVAPHPKTGSPVCGLFLFGIDLSFDGELLLDAHAIDSRGLISNIRDFDYDVGRAFLALAKVKDEFVEKFIGGFCPVRSPKLGEWLDLKKRAKLEAEIMKQIRDGQSLLKFAYLGQGADRFIEVTESPGYHSGRIEKELLASNSKAIREFLAKRRIVVLGAGDHKLQYVVGDQRGAVLVDMSKRMLEISKDTVASPKLIEADFETIDLSGFGKGGAFVVLGNTLGNFEDMRRFLEGASKVSGSRMVAGMELIPNRDSENLDRILAEYTSEKIFRFLFTPLEMLGVSRADGGITVSFNWEKKRVEHWFEFSSGAACGKLAKKLGLESGSVRRILLSTSSKLSEEEFLGLVEESGLAVEKKFSEGSNFIFLLVNAG